MRRENRANVENVEDNDWQFTAARTGTNDDEDEGDQHKNGRARQFDSQEPARQSSRHENQK